MNLVPTQSSNVALKGKRKCYLFSLLYSLSRRFEPTTKQGLCCHWHRIPLLSLIHI